jgi:Predicted phosphatase homologous to the C-terminal domain of histone macroH2A1
LEYKNGGSVVPFKIIRNDITKVKADAIVNTVNPYGFIGRGVETAIYHAAGSEELLEERRKLGILHPGDVGITPAFNLDAKYIIHVSGPVWKDGRSNELAILRQCYDKALYMAVENNCKSIAFPLLATGTYRFPEEISVAIAVEAFTEFLKEYEIEIFLVVFGSDAVRVSGTLVDKVTEFIDDDYVAAANATEYLPVDEDYNAYEDDYYDEDDDEYLGYKELPYQNLNVRKPEVGETQPEYGHSSLNIPDFLRKKKSENVSESLEDVLKKIYTESFEKHLQQLINKKGLKNSEVYATSNISKQYFSKLLKGKVKPSKEKVLALAVGLRLNIDETVDFLRIAGYALSPISQTDKVVEYFIRNEDYNVIKIDIVLFDFGLEPLSS